MSRQAFAIQVPLVISTEWARGFCRREAEAWAREHGGTVAELEVSADLRSDDGGCAHVSPEQYAKGWRCIVARFEVLEH